MVRRFVMALAVGTAGFLGVSSASALTSLEVASRADTGANPGAPVTGAGISGDGSSIAFVSADVLAAGGNGIRQLYVRDTATSRTRLASRGRSGQPANAAVEVAEEATGALSADGRYAVFASRATNLVSGDPDGTARDVFRTDLLTGAIRRVSAPDDGAVTGYETDTAVDISADGSRVAYGRQDGTGPVLVVRDLLRGGEAVVSVAPDGSPLPGPFSAPSLSADGRSVVFSSGGVIYVRQIDDGVTQALIAGTSPDISGDGSVVAHLVGAQVRRTVVATAASQIVSANGTDPRISTDGRRLVWTELADTAVGDTNGQPDIYGVTAGGVPFRVSQGATAATQVPRAATSPLLSASGGRAAFTMNDGPAPSASLAPGDTDRSPDVIVGTMGATDRTDPQISIAVSAAETTAPAVTVSGRVTDPSGIAFVIVRGTRARVDTAGNFAVTVSLVGGVNPIPVRAMDGAGRSSQVAAVVSRSLAMRLGIAAVPRATGLSIGRSPKRTIVRFRLSERVTRTYVGLSRRQPVAGKGTRFVPVGKARRLGGTPGARGGLLSTRPLARGIYQVRVTVVSPQGVRVTAHRFVEQGPKRTVKKAPAKKAPAKRAPAKKTPRRTGSAR